MHIEIDSRRFTTLFWKLFPHYRIIVTDHHLNHQNYRPLQVLLHQPITS